MPDPDWQADLARYPRRSLFKEQSLWAIAVYRFGRRVDRRPPGLVRKVQTKFYWLAFYAVETLTGVSLPKSATIGPGLRIWHFGNIFVTHDAVIGANCTLRQGVSIGNRVDDGPSPTLEDDVELGAYAQVLGPVRVGRGAKVGAMSVVLKDVPPDAVAVGVPARIVGRPAGIAETNPTDDAGAGPFARKDEPNGRRRPAVFLDRDGTIIENVPYLADPSRVRPYPDAISSLRSLREAGFALVVVSNQSGVGRGMIGPDQLAAVNEAVGRAFAGGGAAPDAIYTCPEVPTTDDPAAVDHPDRKPAPGMLLRAAADLGLDLAASWMVGDRLSDVLAGVGAGCRGSILVRPGNAPAEAESAAAAGHPVVADLAAAAALILAPAAPRLDPATPGPLP